MEIPMGGDSFFAGWVYDLLCSVRPQMQQHNLRVADESKSDQADSRC
jgi:hypothetical protein